uniref:RNA-directed DNA polymerase, eukaryota, reverse transcriptase zinc-binding domain protein n=1 Tax=Tanacetum cinerariifolium TaxID=118510 RepID=A0A6L2LSN9_TANCI|nr:RNA-directed DNA polymerase, eukaryota, reverse transcriptase zinc-binding domain protein [Tanacetum cinerariifolium]
MINMIVTTPVNVTRASVTNTVANHAENQKNSMGIVLRVILCHEDKESIRVIKDALKDFSEVFGLQPNLSKSTVFFGNVNYGEQRSILKVLPFKIGSLPAKYLGVPLITKRLGEEDCKHLVDMVKNKVNDWKNKFLYYAGRMQLIAFVLGSMQIY